MLSLAEKELPSPSQRRDTRGYLDTVCSKVSVSVREITSITPKTKGGKDLAKEFAKFGWDYESVLQARAIS